MSRYIFNKNNSFPRELEVIHKLTEKLKDRLEAEKLVKWVLQNRKIKIKYYLKLLDRLKSKLISNVQKLNSLSGSTTLEDKFKTLLGELHHCQTQEPYYYETSYQVLHTETTVVVNHEGEAMLNSNNGGSKVWACNFQICLLDELVLQNLLASFKYFIELTPAKLFTDLLDNQSPYARHLTTINSVKPHSPQLRTLSRLLYDLHFTSRTIHIIEDKLNSADVERLKELGDPTKIKGVSVEVDKEIDTTEDTIIERYKIAFKLLKKRSLDTPKNECMSCHRLLCLRDVSSINKLRNPPTTDTWKRLKFFYDCHKLSPSSFVCHNCLTKFRANEIPSHCILNDLFFNEVPEVIKSLNNFEKMLIQRAKAFQVVTSMIPVGNKHIPNRETIKKVKGRTFHLPLPLETTLKKLPNPEEPINRDQELYILVRSTATKNKIVWEDLVDVNKIYKALEYLKTHNNHYANIVLPHNPDLLLADLRDDLQHEVVVSSSIDNSTVDGEALLTQINEEEEQESTEQYTIYPLHEKRQNAPITALYQMLKVNAAPFDSRDSSIDVKCFPDLFVEGKFGQFHPRSVKLTSSEFIKCVLTSKHSRFRLNQQYLFFLLNDANIRQLNAGIFYKLNTTNQNEKLTAQSYLEKLSNDDLEGDMQAVFSRLRNTEQYWKKPRSDVVCMTRHYGPATWFLTISPSEWMWSDLGHYIKSINGPDMANKSTSELVALDPVAASRFMDNHFKAMMDFITSPDAPLGIIEHYFWRREYQSRGLQHFHIMLWVKDAPVLEESTAVDVAQFIAQYVTCHIPDKSTFPTLYDRVINYQTHRHNSYCLRKKKTSRGFVSVCRFGFPRPVTETIDIRSVTESIAARKTLTSNNRLYHIVRSKECQFINDYNSAILLAWNGNMDIQYVGEKTAVLNYYITKYTTKGERSHTTDTFDTLHSTKSLASRLFNVGLRALNNRECGTLEASDTLLSIPLHGTDPHTTIRWIDINVNRNRRVKPKKAIHELDPTSTDIYFDSWVDTHYPQRPKDLDGMHLYDFVRWHDIVSSRPKSPLELFYELSSCKFLKKRQRPYLINHYMYDINKCPEKYYFSIILLFYPWRDLAELKAGKNTYTEAFDVLKQNIRDGIDYGNLQSDFVHSIEKAFELIEAKISEIELVNDHVAEDDGLENPLDFEPVEAINAMDDFRQVRDNISSSELDTLISKLNSDQLRVFQNVTLKLGENTSILRHFVSGTGGTGKSFLINTIKHWVATRLHKLVAVGAPTGIAAFNVNGLTIHRLLQLPVEHGNTLTYKPLSDQVIQVLRADLADVILLIIDEVSMISNVTLLFIHLRLTEIFDTGDQEDGWFGRIHLLLFGDLLQLPPVRQNPSYESLKPDETRKLIGSLSAPNLWNLLFTYDELTLNMRQKDDATFVDMLHRLRLGVVTKADQDLLSNRLIPISSGSNTNRLEEVTTYLHSLPDNTVCLLPTKHMCHQLNTGMLKLIPEPELTILAKDEIDCPRYLHKRAMDSITKYDDDSSMTAGLERQLIVKIGARVMLRRNIDISLGLVNGSIGTIQQVLWDIDNRSVVQKLRIKFSHGLVYDLERIPTKFEIISRAYVHRHQFPICLAYAITIHKSQGLSLPNALLDVGASIFSCGQAYVALSRVTSLQGVHLINFDPCQVKAKDTAIVEYNRLRSIYRPDLTSITINKSRRKKTKDRIWASVRVIDEAQDEFVVPQHKPARRSKPYKRKSTRINTIARKKRRQ